MVRFIRMRERPKVFYLNIRIKFNFFVILSMGAWTYGRGQPHVLYVTGIPSTEVGLARCYRLVL